MVYEEFPKNSSQYNIVKVPEIFLNYFSQCCKEILNIVYFLNVHVEMHSNFFVNGFCYEIKGKNKIKQHLQFLNTHRNYISNVRIFQK